MIDFFESIAFGFKTILKWNMIKIALISGLLTSAIWIVIAIFAWNPLVSFSSFILELVPFFMVRSNGAEIISVFIWAQAVLITFALIVAFFGTLLSKKIPKERYRIFYFTIIACSAIFWTIVWFVKGSYLHVQFAKILTLLPFGTIDKGMAYLISCLIIYNLIIISMLFITSILSKVVLSKVNDDEFGSDVVLENREFKIIKYTIKDTLIFIGVSTVFFPLFFVPFLNFIVQIGLWTYLVRNTFRYDVGVLLFEKFNNEKLKAENKAIWSISFVAALFNFLPVLNVFGPFFGEITMFHYLKNSKGL